MQTPKLIFAAVIAAGSLVAAMAPASAMPAANVQEGASSVQIEQAGWRCGPGAHMNRWGRCVYNGRPMYHHRRWRRY